MRGVAEAASILERLVLIALKERIRLKRGENVIVETYPHGMAFASEFVYQARALGAHPLMIVEDEPSLFRTVEALKPGAMKAGTHEWAALSKAQAYVFVTGPADLPRAWSLGPKWGAAFPSNEEWYSRAKRGRVRGVRMIYGYATKERAQAYGVDVEEWSQMMLEGAAVPPGPIRAAGKALAKKLLKAKQVHITADNGTDLTFRLIGRRPQVDDGSVSLEDLKNGDNMTQAPAGQLWVAPDEKSPEGTIVFDRPSNSFGRWVKGVTLEFRGGRLTASSFQENGEAFEKAFSRAKGDKDRLGMFIFGLNPGVRVGFPQAPMAAGCVSLTLGDNGEIDGKNKTDFTFLVPHASATVELDGKQVVERGRLMA